MSGHPELVRVVVIVGPQRLRPAVDRLDQDPVEVCAGWKLDGIRPRS